MTVNPKVQELGNAIVGLVDTRAKINLSNLSKDGEGKLSASGMFYSTEPINDARGYEQVREMRHSTFDRSKITVVGNPTITKDGIASGFSINDYLKVGNNKELLNKDWTVKCTAIYKDPGEVVSFQPIISLGGFLAWGSVTIVENNRVYFYTKAGIEPNATTEGARGVVPHSFKDDEKFSFSLTYEHTSNKYSFFIQFEDTENLLVGTWIPEEPAFDKQLTPIIGGGNIILGRAADGGERYFRGSIDLKQLQVYTSEGVQYAPEKVTIVGDTVTISNGFASGFSNDNYITVPIETVAGETESFRIKGSFRTSDKVDSGLIFVLLGNSSFHNNIRFQWKTSGKGFFFYYNTGATTWYDNKDLECQLNTTYYYTIEYSLNSLRFYLGTNKDHLNLYVDDPKWVAYNISQCKLGGDSTGGNPLIFSGVIDLKDFSYSRDKQGYSLITKTNTFDYDTNKKGADIIKSLREDFIILGAPTISEDNILSNITPKNFAMFRLPKAPTKSIEIDSSFTFAHSSRPGSNEGTIWNYNFNFDFRATHKLALRIPVGPSLEEITNKYITFYDDTYNFIEGKRYDTKVLLTNEKVIVSISGFPDYIEYIPDIRLDYLKTEFIRLGQSNAFDLSFAGSIDLNAFKVYVDGDLVYQPCLRIPYTLSKSTSKIVDADARSRVIDLYEQEGRAKYYTIDEDNRNFTVPLGDSYSLSPNGTNGKGSGFSLFDTKLSDHILTGNESLGWALQGTWVHKGVIPEVHEGYPDFYNKCLEEYVDGANEPVDFWFPWEQPILTGESETLGGDKFGVTASSQHDQRRAWKAFNNNWHDKWGLSNINNGWITFYNPEPIRIESITSQPPSDYPNEDGGKLVFEGSNDNNIWEKLYETTYRDQEEFYPINAKKCYKYFRISLSECISNYSGFGELKIKAYTHASVCKRNAGGHIYYDVKDKAIVDKFYNIYGIADFYGMDVGGERVFLPRNNFFYQLTGDTVKVNGYNEAGLPNIYAVMSSYDGNMGQVANNNNTRNDSAAYMKKDGKKRFAFSYAGFAEVGPSIPYDTLDASRNSKIYGNSDTVQPASSNKLLYYCVGNTVTNSTLIDTVDITSAENDTIPLLFSCYQSSKLSSLGWLRADGTKKHANAYPAVYNKLKDLLTNNPDNIKVVGEAGMLPDTDYTDYYIVNTSEQTFQLPIRTGQRVLVSKKVPTDTDKTWYNLYSDGWIEQGGESLAAGRRTVTFVKPFKSLNYQLTANIWNDAVDNYSVIAEPKTVSEVSIKVTGVQEDPQVVIWSASGYTAVPQYNDYTEDVYLYVKVGNAVQHLEVIDLIREADLNTPFFFGMHQFFDVNPTNASWLKSTGQWNDKDVFVDFYAWLEKVQEGSIDPNGASVKLSTETYSDTDYVINKATGEFRLPIAVAEAAPKKTELYFYVGNTLQGANLIDLHKLGTLGNQTFDLFDTKTTDRELLGNSSEGWAEQGTTVYRNAIPNGRKGYPVFYDTCLEEYSGAKEEWLANNAYLVGPLENNKGVISNFVDQNSYIDITNFMEPAQEKWELKLKFRYFGDIPKVAQCLVGARYRQFCGVHIRVFENRLDLHMSNNNSSWNIALNVRGNTILTPGTVYYLKLVYDKTKYTMYLGTSPEFNDTNVEFTVENATPVVIGEFILGAYNVHNQSWKGEIDLNGCSIQIGDKVIWRGAVSARTAANGHRYYDIKDKKTVDFIFDKTGVNDYYGIDTEVQRVLLPKINVTPRYIVRRWAPTPTDPRWYTLYSDGWVEQGGKFPGRGGAWGAYDAWFLKPFKNTDYYVNAICGHNSNTDSPCIDFKKTNYFRCNPYNNTGNGNWYACGYTNEVQLEPRRKVYYCVGNTSVVKTSPIVEEFTDITTTENDTIPLLFSCYQHSNISSAGWLKADNNPQPGDTYKAVYEMLTGAMNNNNPKKFKVVEEADMTVDGDYTDFFKINSANRTFTLPIRTDEPVLVMIKEANNEVQYDSYKVYSNGWTELVVQRKIPNIDANWRNDQIITFPRPFINTNYSIEFGDVTLHNGGYGTGAVYHSKERGSFKANFYNINNDGGKTTIRICGYTKAPELSEYTEDVKLFFKVGNAVQHAELVDMIHSADVNVPYFYGHSQYFESAPNNLSWLASTGQWNERNSYPDFYDWLEGIYTGRITAEGVVVKQATENPTEFDYVIDLDAKSFKLPTYNGSEDIMSDKFTDLELGATDSFYDAPANGWYSLAKEAVAGQHLGLYQRAGNRLEDRIVYSSDITAAVDGAPKVNLKVKRGDRIFVGYNTSGPTHYFTFTYAKGNGTLYYYVGETIQNTKIIDVARLTERVNKNITIVESYQNGTSWYRMYSDGWVEQGGRQLMTSNTDGNNGAAKHPLRFVKSFRDTNYSVLFNSAVGTGGWQYANGAYADYTDLTITDRHTVQIRVPSGNGNIWVTWFAYGYAR